MYVSSLNPNLLIDHPNLFSKSDFVLTNWQDKRYSNWLTFDGLVDESGNKKQILGEVKSILNNTPFNNENLPLRILKPARPIYAGGSSNFKAVYFKDNLWKSATEDPVKFSYEWKLLKTDEFGFPLATLPLGSGPEIYIRIPENYERYQLILTAKNLETGYVTQTWSKLNTKLYTE